LRVLLRVALLTGLALASGCGRLGFTSLDAAPDGLDAQPDALELGPWSAPQPLTILNTTMDESDPDLRGDGLELVFHSLRNGGLGGYDLYHATRATTADPFGAPTALTSLETAGDEGWPSLTADGLTILFSDNQDLFFATRPSLGAPFGARQALPELSSADVDTTPELSRDGLIAMVTRGVTNTRDIWMYTRAADGPPNVGWSAPVRLVELASSMTDASPDLDEHGLTIHFHSDRGGGKDDLYVATRASPSEPFGTPMLVTELDTTIDEGDPTTSADQRIIVFHRALELYMATR
jgi:hypothetical protein